MDVSKILYPLIIAAVLGLGWLLTSGGVNYQFKKYSEPSTGDVEADSVKEAGLTKLGGFLMFTFRYEKAGQCFDTALTNYPDGKNYWYNYYRLAKCKEKAEKWGEAVSILIRLRDENAIEMDDRVPDQATLDGRIQKLIEVHELPIKAN